MFIINAKIRIKQGKGANRRLRTDNKFPGIIYGGNAAPIPIELEHDKIWNIQNKTEFYRNTLTILIEGENKKEIVKVQSIQRHAYKPKLTHIDFMRI